jgi:hypothetical protein
MTNCCNTGGAEAEYVEGSLREIVARAGDTVTALRRQTEDLAADERALDGKIKKAQVTLKIVTVTLITALINF